MPLKDLPLNSPPSDSLQSDGSQLILPNYQLRERFQGAALGLMLTPFAIYNALIHTQHSAIACDHATQAAKAVSPWLERGLKLLRHHDQAPVERHSRLLEDMTL